jgi:hypothetical protein
MSLQLFLWLICLVFNFIQSNPISNIIKKEISNFEKKNLNFNPDYKKVVSLATGINWICNIIFYLNFHILDMFAFIGE